ncbi:hypothetical protein SAMN05216474_1026 [Lishizhenia tianjinensis]|uniref:GLPGLI family protein n=1 Tax=Lishizhenia tianjinensis TaxID=477690 RepID=A0A1I6YMI5_9FLAO|nr:hypothetical protein [Lishizhenia tianjinensis]SFT51713.1 hypothetical protein SAMN05216474_1026 [Lishizhenia tianjinensis]
MQFKNFFYVLLVASVMLSCSGKKENTSNRFEGRLVYKITSNLREFDPADSMSYQIIYAKDSLVKTDNFTRLGKQSYLKHILKNRAYTLMNFQGNKLALQSIPDSTKVEADKYTFFDRDESKEIAGLKANLVEVKIKGQKEPYEMWYTSEISHDYSEAIPGMKGLPVVFTLVIGEEELTYTLIEAERKTMDRDHFGLPSDYKVITTQEFEAYITAPQEEM